MAPSRAGLGPGKPVVPLADLVDWFYSYLEFTKVWSRRVIAEAASSAVAAGRVGMSPRGIEPNEDSEGGMAKACDSWCSSASDQPSEPYFLAVDLERLWEYRGRIRA